MSDTALIDWDMKPLGQLAEARRGITYSSAMLKSEEGGLPYINMKSFFKGGGFNVDGTKHYAGTFTQQDVVGDRDLLIANTDVTAGDIIGVPALLPEELAAEQVLYSHHVTRLRINGEVTVPFLYYLLCLPEYRSQLLRIARGTTVLMLDMPAIMRITICAPKNEVEQNRIVKILSTLDRAIEKTEALIAKYQQIKAGLMHDLFTRGVTANGKLRLPREQAPALYQESPIGWIPKGWDVKRLVDITAFPSGQVDPRQSQFAEWILVAPDHIEKETGRLLEMQTAREQGAISGKYTFQPGDIVYSKIRPYLRKAILADFTGLCSADMYPLRPVSGVNPRYLLGVVLGDHFSRFAESVSMRSGFPKINRDEMSGYRCAVPPSLEQEIIAEILLIQDAMLTTTQEEVAKLRQQKLGLMSDLLTGRVRVND